MQAVGREVICDCTMAGRRWRSEELAHGEVLGPAVGQQMKGALADDAARMCAFGAMFGLMLVLGVPLAIVLCFW